jgi:hypothetical protein
LLLSVLAATGLVAANVIPLIRTPFQIDYGEGLMLDGAIRIQHGQPLYPNPFDFPVVLHVYGPVAYAAVASVSPASAPAFTAGRWLIAGCALTVSALLGLVVWRETGAKMLGVSFGFLLLTLPSFRFWCYLLRSDLIGLAFSMMGVALYLRGKRPYWSIPFFAMALFSKYSLIAAPIAVLAHLGCQRKLKQGGEFLAGLCVACLVPFGILQMKTGHWFAFHMFSTHADPFSLRQYLGLMALVTASAPVVTALALWHTVQSVRTGRPSLPALYLVVSLVAALTAGKLGSTTNHFLEWMLAACLCAGLAYSELLRGYPAKAFPVTILLSASVLIGVILEDRPSLRPFQELAECGPSYKFVKDAPSTRVLSESLGPVLMAGKPVMVSDPFEYGQLVRHGLWPDRRVEELLREQGFGLIVLADDPVKMQIYGSEVWSDALLTAMSRNYRVAARFKCRYAGVMLEPKP